MKRNRRFRRHTVKKSKYGGMEVAVNKPKMSLVAEPFIPAPKPKPIMNPAAEEWHPPAPAAPVAPVDPFQANTEFDTLYKGFLMTPINEEGNPLAEQAVAIDCEMVGLKPDDKSALAHVAICDFNGNKLLDKYVIPKGGLRNIMNYRTKWSGIKKGVTLVPYEHNPENQYDFVKEEVHGILNGKIIVGHGLDSDFDVLEYATLPMFVWDSTKIPKYLRPEGTPYKLKLLASKIGNNIQRNEVDNEGKPKGHSPLEDARAAMNLFRTYMGYPKIDYTANGRTWRN